MDERYDAIVIGAGIVGASTALHLLMRGKRVLLVDRRGPGEETSYGNAGMIEVAHVMPFAFPAASRWMDILLHRDTMARIDYRHLPRSLPWIIDFFLQSRPDPLRKNGRVMWPLIAHAIQAHQKLMQGTEAGQYWKPLGRATLYRSEESFARDAFMRSVCQEVGVPFEVIQPSAFQEMEPDIKPFYSKVVKWTSTANISNPSVLVKIYADRFVREGGTFMHADIKRIDLFKNKWRVGTSQGIIEAENIVLCMGPWTTDITKRLGYSFPLGFKRGYHRHFSLTGSAKFSHTLSDAVYGYSIAPMEQGYRIATGAEFADRDAPPHPQQLDLILPRARELFPLGEPVEAKPWMGSRPCFPDSLPVIGPASRHKGLWFNFGHGHVGLTIGPASARLLAEMMTNNSPFCDPSPYRATRFNC